MASFGPKPILNLPYNEYVGQTLLSFLGIGTYPSTVSNQLKQLQLLWRSSWYLFDYTEAGLVTIPAAPNSTTTAAIGSIITDSCGSTGSTVGVASLTATAGTTSTITTNQTLPRSLAGYKVFITEGPNAGSTLIIRSNTIGANSVLTVDTQATAFNATTKYKLMTPRFYYINTVPANSLAAYDWATNSWLALSVAGVTSAWGTSANKVKLIATPSYLRNSAKVYASGTATAGGASTLTNSSKAWATNQWANYQVRLTAGTGAGQIGSIASNTSTVITVSTAWSVQPDSTTQYNIEPNENYIYGLGGATSDVSLWRYSISSNSWSLITPTVARGGYTRYGDWQVWMNDVEDSGWNDETSFKNGRYIYDGRTGSGATNLDRYDIAENKWESVNFPLGNFVTDAGGPEGFSVFPYKNRIYVTHNNSIYSQTSTLDVVLNENFPGFGSIPTGQSGFSAGLTAKYWGIEVTLPRQTQFYIYGLNVQGSSSADAGPMARRIIIQ